jgi:peptide/nickel transport system permease protein
MDYASALARPSIGHPLGTDNFGRDVLSRVLYGYRISLAVALGSVAAALLIGVPLGLAAGFFGGGLDNLIMRPMDVLISFPALVLVVALAGFLGQGTTVMVLAIAIIYVPTIVRVMRASAMEVSRELFVEGARARGASNARLVLRHVLPNAWSPVLVQASILMGIAILIEAALSFIGLGTQPPDPSLGLMLSEGRVYMREAPWLVIFPGLAIGIAVLGFNLLGDGLRNLLEPTRRE